MAYSVSDLSPSPATYPHAVCGRSLPLSAVERKNLCAASVADTVATEDVKAHYTEIFNHHEKVQNNLLQQLNDIFGKSIPMDGNRHVNFTDFIQDVCVDSDRANDAYKFYGRQIIEQINQLGDYILKARALLQQVSEGQNWIIDQLDILDGFSKDINETFGFRYIYDRNEDIWKLYEDNYAEATHTQVSKKDTYEELRTMEVQAYEKQEYQKDPVLTQKTIEVFNELNLLDRLKYIKLYYDIDGGKTDAVFPNDKIIGVPTIKEASNTDVVGAIEHFFMGYLIDRDGPVNAMSSFLEVKSAALIEKINIESQKIKALNVYLKFLQRALDILNASQSGTDGNGIKRRLPDGAMAALTFLCGGNMYNLFEASDGTPCLVLEDPVEPGKYLPISADEAGMRYLFGDVAFVATDKRGNGHLIATKEKARKSDTFDFLESAATGEPNFIPFNEEPRRYFNAATTTIKRRWTLEDYDRDLTWYDSVGHEFGNNFSLPTQIDCEKIDPKSVRRYSKFWTQDEITTETVSSWQKAFQDKFSLVQTAMDTVNSDIKVFRNKIDTLNTLSNTFRNRTYSAYMKIGSNLKK